MTKFLVVLLGIAACGGPQNPRARARAEVADVVREQIDAWADLAPERFEATLAPDVVFVGHWADELYVGRDAVTAAMREGNAHDRRTKLAVITRWQRLDAEISADGDVAWVAGRFVFDVLSGGDRQPLETRLTEVLVRGDDGWSAIAMHFALPVEDEDALDGAAGGRWPELVPVPDIVDDGADELASRIEKDLRDPDALSAAFAADAIYVGPGANDFLVGADAAAWVEQLGVAFLREGKNRVVIAPGGQVGWTITNLEVSAPYERTAVTMPTRALLVYERRAGLWTLVQAHFSYGPKDPM